MSKASARRRHRRRRSRTPPPGSAPGTLAHREGEPPPKLHAVWYDAEHQAERVLESPAEIPALIADPNRTVWIDVQGLGDLGELTEIGRLLAIDPLAVADIANAPQPAKVETYADRLLFIGHMVTAAANGGVEEEQLSVVLGPNWVVSFQEKPGDVFEPLRQRIRSTQTRVRRMGADFLTYALIDAVVDACLPVVERIGERLDALEDEVMERPTRETLVHLHDVRRQLLHLHRIEWRQRDVIASLWRDESLPIGDAVRPFLRDVHDHAFVVLDAIETFRDLSVGLMDLYLSAASNRLNEVMTTLTLVATIFIPLSFVVGVYGMNFDVMPELHWRWGYAVVWGVMIAIAGGLVWWFRRRRWL